MVSRHKLLVIGGSDAGISAALRVRELEPAATISVLLADACPNYSICGLPFYLSGEVEDWHRLAHRTEFSGIEILVDHRAHAVDTAAHIVQAVLLDGASRTFDYDRLLIATGAAPALPAIDGLHHPGVFPLHAMDDSFAVDRQSRSASTSSPRRCFTAC